MRTQDEIIARVRNNANDLFGFSAEVLVPFLPYEKAKEFLNPDAKPEHWPGKAITRENILGEMEDYMDFAWEKALGHRGLSAGRSVAKMTEWLWLLQDDALLAFAQDNNNYPCYGAPILKAICVKYGFPMPESDAADNMANGKPCTPNCKAGCRA